MNAKQLLKPCPFCGGSVGFSITDSEGNLRDEDYEEDPWSGLGFQLKHEEGYNKGCPIASHEDESIGVYIYDSREDAAEAWNKRKEITVN